MKRTVLLIALLAAAGVTSAASWTYRGTLNDGGKAANGNYDVRLTLISAAGTASVSQPITVYNVPVIDGNFAAEVDFGMDLALAPAMKLKTEVGQDGSGFVSLGEPSAFDPKSALAVGACWSSTGDNGSNPTVNFLGNTDNQTMVVSSPSGVSLNKRAQIASSTTDLLVAPKATGDADADITFETRSEKRSAIYVRDLNGNFVVNSSGINEFFGSNTIAASGSPTSVFQGRLQSNPGGTAATDPGGGIWLGSDTGATSYMGRGNNGDNYSGFWHDGIWRLIATERGEVGINTTVIGAAPDLRGNEVVINNSGASGDIRTSIGLMNGNFGWDISYQSDTGRLSLGTQNASGIFPTITPRFEINHLGTFSSYAFGRSGTAISSGAVLQVGTTGSNGNGALLTAGGTWTNASSRTLKEGFMPVNPLDVLNKVAALPISKWTYIASNEGTHIGPMAEDFKETFGLAGDGKSIGTVDADGVALAAIQGLNQKLESENAALRLRLEAIEAKLAD